MLPFNPLALIAWWREILIGLLVVSVGIQSYRLQGAQGERDLLALEKTERIRRDAMRDITNLKNKERTNEEDAAARRRAAAVVVRVEGPGIKYVPPAFPGSGDESTASFYRRILDEELAAAAQRNADRHTELARAGEDLAAAYRACRGYTLNLQ